MATPDIDLLKQRNDPQYLNWLGVGDSLRILSDGLRKYAKTEMVAFHSAMLKNLAGVPVCNCPTGKPGKNPHTCRWAKELEKCHCIKKKSRIPWHQSDSKKWIDPNNGYWEVAKLFMSNLGSNWSNVIDPYSTDLTGLLNLLYFCTHFKVQQPLVQSVRDWRNKWAHAISHVMPDKDKQSAIQAIFDLLNDAKLITCKEIQECRPAIEKVRDGNVSILQENELVILKELTKCKEFELNRNTKKEREEIERDLKSLHEIVRTLVHFQEASAAKKNEKELNFYNLFMIIISLPICLFLNSSTLKHFRWILFIITVFAIIHMEDKSIPPSDTGCPRANLKSPIGQYGFQEFNFSSYLNYKKGNFFGRKWLFQELENILANESSPLGVLITGGPGSGKSALMSQLICSPFSSLFIHNSIIGYHMCDYSEKGKRSGARFVRNLVDQIAGNFPEFADHISSDKQVRDQLDKHCVSDPVGCFHGALLGPLRELKNLPDGLRYIFVDGLDECFEIDRKSSEILDILSDKLLYFPNWLKVIFSSRNWTAVTTKLPQIVHRISLDPSDERNIADIRSYISHFVSENTFFLDKLLEAIGLKNTAEGINTVVNEITRKGDGNFLFVKTTLEYLNKTQGKLINLDSLPTRLHDTYAIFFKRQFSEANFRRFKTVFEVLLAASFPLKDMEIASILKLYDPAVYTKSYTFQLLQELSSFLRYGQNRTISIYHKSFADWLIDRTNDASSLISVNKSIGHQCIAEYLIDVIEKKNTTPSLEEFKELAVQVSLGGMLEKHLKKLRSLNVSEIRDACGKTILHDLAAKDGKVLVFNTLIELFPSTDVPDGRGTTPAFYATFKGNVENLKTLIKSGIDLNYRVQHFPPLSAFDPIEQIMKKSFGMVDCSISHVAALEGHLKIIKLLIESDASVTEPNSFGITPFHLAAQNGHLEIVKLLFRCGTIPDRISLHHAAAKNHIHVVRFLLKTAKVKDVCLPCKPGTISDIGVDATIQDIHAFFCETALHVAVTRRHFKVVKLLMSFDRTSLNCIHFTGKTPLMVAVEKNDTEMVQVLLDEGANVESECPTKLTTSRLKVKEEICNMLSYVKERFLYSVHCGKKDCSCKNRALHLCAEYGFWEIAEQLIDWGANITAKECRELGPVDVASMHDHLEFYVNLNRTYHMMHRTFFIPTEKTLYFHVLRGCLNVVEYEISRHLNIFLDMTEILKYRLMLSAVQWSPYLLDGTIDKDILLQATAHDNSEINFSTIIKKESKRRLEILQIITEYRKNVLNSLNILKMRDGLKRVILHTAAEAGFVDAVKYLVFLGSDWKAKDILEKTPLILALDATPKKPERFATYYYLEDEKISKIYKTTTYDETVAYLISLDKKTKCDLEGVKILNMVIDKQMPLSLYQLLKNGVDINCHIDGTVSPLLRHLQLLDENSEQINEIFSMFKVKITMKCGVSWLDSELHFISGLSNAGIFFKPSDEKHESANPTFIKDFTNCYDSEGYLPIHRAARGGNFDAVDFFISSGTNVLKKTKSGLTSLEISIFCLGKQVVSFMHLDVVDDGFKPVILNPTISSQIIKLSERVRIFKKILVAFCTTNRSSNCLNWCSPNFTGLSPLHFAASKGIGTFEFVYKQIKRIIPSLPRNCTNKHNIDPLYLAQVHHPVFRQHIHCKNSTYIKFFPSVLSDTAKNETFFRFPDREAEYHIIYNSCFETPNIKFLDTDIGDAINCPGFYELLPEEAVLRDKMKQCYSACMVLTSYVHNLTINTLSFKLQQWRKSGSNDEWRPKISLMLELLYYSEKHNFPSCVKMKIEEALLCSRKCRCTYLMMILQQAFTSQPNDIAVNMFNAKRMGWKEYSLKCGNNDLWPFHFLFKKALRKYNSYKYLMALNVGFEIDKQYFFSEKEIVDNELNNMDDTVNKDNDIEDELENDNI